MMRRIWDAESYVMSDASKRRHRARLYERGASHLQVVIDPETRETLQTLKRKLRMKRQTSGIVKIALRLLLEEVSRNTITA